MFRLLRLIFVLPVFFLNTHVARAANVLGYPNGMRDGLLLIEGAALQRNAKSEGVQFSPQRGVELAPGVAQGFIELGPLETDFPFTEIIPSWNGNADSNSGFKVSMQVTGRGWQSPVIEAGTWGIVPPQQTGVVPFPGGTWHIDYGVFDKPADRLFLRVDLMRSSPTAASPSVRLLAFSYSGVARLTGAAKGGRTLPSLAQDESWPIPFHSQVVERKAWIGRLCSPASVTSVANYLGAKTNTQAMAESLYDPANDLFGVWNRSIMGPAQLGLRGYITRMRNWEDVRAAMARGQAVCASIRFARGEVRGAPVMYNKRGTEGHLVVIVGFTKDGKVITHDSSSKDNGVRCTWPAEEFAKAWFDKGGVAYVFSRPVTGGSQPNTNRRR